MNLYLTGMMGCGKSTLGRMLAERAGRVFIDLDDEIARRAQMTIPEIFAAGGEATFRAQESACLLDVSQKSGAIVATGGGIVLSSKNVEIMRRTGKILFLRRPLECILATFDGTGRPLAGTAAEFASRYRDRLPLYLSSADAVVDNPGTPEEVLPALMAHLCGSAT